jgi:predicted permease
MDSLLQDLRFGLRSLRKNVGLTLVAVLSLGLGIGANTTVFTWLNAFVIQPLPMVPDYGRLMGIFTRGPSGAEWSVSYLSLRDWREQSKSLDIAAGNFAMLGLRGEGFTTERSWGYLATGNYFEVLKVRPALGRLLSMADENERTPVVVLGYAYWQRRFAGDSAIIGRHLVLNGNDLTVVGIAPPRFGGSMVGLVADLFLPITLQPRLAGFNNLEDRQSQWLDGIGRLRDGWTVAAAREELDALAKRVGAETGDTDAAHGAWVKPLNRTGPSEMMRPVFLALLGVTAVVLLIACANVANLLLARAVSRRREIAVRLALGANRGRLMRQLLTESLALGLAAGLVGILVSFWSRDLLLQMVPPAPFPIGLDFAVRPSVLVFALAVSIATSLLFGLAPAVQASRPALVPALKDGIGGEPSPRARLQAGLVVAQVALSLVSLVCAGLFIRSLQASSSVETGFSGADHVLLANTDFRLAGVPDSSHAAVVQRLLEAMRAVPGVEAASVATMVPLGFGGTSSRGTEIEGYTPQTDENLSLQYSMVGDDYFRAMGIRLVRGRAIGQQDAAGAPAVAVVNERFVDKFWPGLDPIGRRFRQGGRWYTVVGVAQQGKYQSLDEPKRVMVYMPYAQNAWNEFTFHVRAAGDPTALSAALRAAAQSVNADLPLLDVRTMAEHMQASLFVQRLGATMLAAFGLMALALSAIGIYGVMSYSVSQRTREIGVRVALGAARRDVVALVVGRAMRLASVGLVIGLAAALGAGQLLRSQLVGVGPRDPLTFTAIVLLLAAVALGASWIPARRAAKVDPMVALRYE